MKQWTNKEFVGILEKNGYYYKRSSGSHSIYVNNKGIHISIPKEIRCVIASRLIKEYNLKV